MSREMKPLTDEFIKNAIASGSIVPPPGGYTETPPWVRVCAVCAFVAGLAGAFLYGLLVR